VKFAFIRDHLVGGGGGGGDGGGGDGSGERFPLELVCEVLEVSRSGYYAWLGRPPSARTRRKEELTAQIRAAHAEGRGNYGSPRVYEALRAGGIDVCQNTVAKLMRVGGLRAKTKRKFVPRTTDSTHERPIAANLLERRFDDQARRPDEAWVADITYVPTDEGWLYVAGVLDLCSRKLVGWSMAEHMETDLVADALKMALARRRPAAAGGLLHHSDRGCQYASEDYQHLLATHGITCSMSNKGDCWDNAAMESFWATLKTELVHHEHYATRAEARASIFEYVEAFYNRKRLHSSLGYKSPEAFEACLN
jgi:transposase InsO family protein